MEIFVQKDTAAYFINGQLTQVRPEPSGSLYENRDVFFNARYIISDGKEYDTEDPESIRTMAAPCFDKPGCSDLGVVGNLVYVMRRKASGLRETGKHDAAIALLKRATEMMPVSEIMWSRRDYMRFPEWLMEYDEPQEAEKAVLSIDTLLTKEKSKLFKIMLHNAELLHTDLVEADYFGGCCEECAKYRGRVFSISGKDRRFPKIPTNYVCTCSGISFYPFIFGISVPSYCDGDIIQYSNRPFVDDRTAIEKEDHFYFRKGAENEKRAEPYLLRERRIIGYDKKQYEKLCAAFPDIAPKSYLGYRRMKKSNSKNYQKLVRIAADAGIHLEYPDDMQKELAELKPIIQEYHSIKAECDAYWENRKENPHEYKRNAPQHD